MADLAEPEMANDGRRNKRRDQLIEAATASYRVHGPASTGLGAICAASQVTKGVFSHHFPGGKDELTAEVVSRNATEVDGILTLFLQRCDTVGDAIVGLFGFYADLLESDPDFGCPIAAAVVDASASDAVVRALAAAAFERWQDVLVSAHSERTGQTADPGIGIAVVAAFEGAILIARSQRNPDVLRSTAKAMKNLFTTPEEPA